MDNVMTDLETLGKGSNAVILSIGAVLFDETGLGSTFYCNVDGQSCVDIGLKLDVSTIMWWMKQGDDARKALTNAKGKHIVAALNDFRDFVMVGAGKDAKLWGNGATFDNVILSNAYELAKIERPWSYKGDRCYRTMKAEYPQITQDAVGVAHNALDDAKYQALHMSKILAHIRGASNAQVV